MLNVTVPFKTERGKVIKHGTVKVPVISEKTHESKAIALLCYFVTERNKYGEINGEWYGEKYVATCVNLKMDGYGESPEHAMNEMRDNVIGYLTLLLKHFKGSLRALEKFLKPDSTDQRSVFLWGVYKKAEGREFTTLMKEITGTVLKQRLNKINCINKSGKKFTSTKIEPCITHKELKYNVCY